MRRKQHLKLGPRSTSLKATLLRSKLFESFRPELSYLDKSNKVLGTIGILRETLKRRKNSFWDWKAFQLKRTMKNIGTTISFLLIQLIMLPTIKKPKILEKYLKKFEAISPQ